MKNNVLEFKTEFNGEDKTRELREFFALVRENNGTPEYPTFALFPPNGRVLAKGMLPEDLETLYGDAGYVGILPVKGLENVIILGRGFTVYHEEKVIPTGQIFYKIDDNGNTKVRPHHKQSYLSFVKLLNNRNLNFYDFHIESWNREEGKEKGFPVFHWFHEFEAGFEIGDNNKNIFFKNCNVSFTGGDGYEINGKNGVEFITIIGHKLYMIGRQGHSPTAGSNILIEGADGKALRRAFCDVEPPETSDAGHVVENLIVRNCKSHSHLLPFPMGGGGVVDKVLFENNKYYTQQPTTFISTGKNLGSRSNITFRGNKMLKSEDGRKKGMYQAYGVKGLKIEDEVLRLDIANSRILATLVDCENVIIKNNNAKNAKYIQVSNCTNVVASGNSEPLNWTGDKEGAIMESEATFEVFEPDFEPYMGFGMSEVPVQPEPTPEPTPIPEEIKTPEEAVSAMEKILEFLKKQNGI